MTAPRTSLYDQYQQEQAGALKPDSAYAQYLAEKAAGGDTTARVKQAAGVEAGLKALPPVKDYAGREVSVGPGFQMLQGATFNLADEGWAGANAVRDALAAREQGKPFLETLKNAYGGNVAAIREAAQRAAQSGPVSSVAAEVVGSLANPVLRLAPFSGAVPEGASAGQRLLAAGKAGALGGAAYGAGAGEGLAGRVGGAALGAAGGTVGGVALRGVSDALGAGVNLAARAAGPTVDARTGAVDPSTLRSKLVRAATGPDPVAAKAVQWLREQGRSVDDVATAARGNADSPLMLGDEPVMGTAGVRLMRAARAASPAAANVIDPALEARAADAGARIGGKLAESAGVAGKDAVAMLDDIVTRQKAAAAKDYAEAYGYGAIQNPETVKSLNDLFNLPDGAGKLWKRAYKAGRRVQAMDPNGAPTAEGAAALNDLGFPVQPSVRDLDLMKRGIDVLTERGANGKGLSRADAKFMRERLNALMQQVDAEVPAYAKARASFAGDAALKDAMAEASDDVAKFTDPRIIAKKLGQMSPSEQEAYRVQWADDIGRKLARKNDDAANVWKSVFGNQAARDAAKAIFPDEASFDAFAKAMGNEKAAELTRLAVTRGSQTADKASDVARLIGTETPMAFEPRTGFQTSPTGYALKALAEGVKRADKLATVGLGGDLAPLLTTPLNNKQAVEAALARLLAASQPRAPGLPARILGPSNAGARLVAGLSGLTP